MPVYKEFESASNDEPVIFTITNRDKTKDEYVALPELPADYMIDLLSVETNAQALRGAGEFIAQVLDEPSAERFKARMSDKSNPISMRVLQDVTKWLIEVYSGNPTDEPSPSPGSSETPSSS